MRVPYCISLTPLVIALAGFQDNSKTTLALTAGKPVAPTAEQSLALETLNGFRLMHGLDPATMDSRLNASAALHAENMAKNNVLSHKESNGVTQDALQRANAFGYNKGVAELVASGQPNAPYAVVSFVDAPYHRRLLLKPGHVDFGCGTDAGFACLVLGGSEGQKIVESPPQGSEGVPTTWDGREEPNPMRGCGSAAPYGYPIMLAAYGYDDRLSMTEASLKSSSGLPIDCVVRQPQNDPDAKNCVIVVPKKPLAAHSAYTVCVKFSLGTETHLETWSFRTGNAAEQPPQKRPRKG